MPTFSSKPVAASSLATKLRRHPFLMFGLPFLTLVVGASYGLEGLTRTRYDLHGQKVQTMEKEEELGMKENRKRVDIREEYYRLNAPPGSASAQPSIPTSKSKLSLKPISNDDYEPVRVPRPAGVPEWGGPATSASEVAELVGRRKTDRWV